MKGRFQADEAAGMKRSFLTAVAAGMKGSFLTAVAAGMKRAALAVLLCVICGAALPVVAAQERLPVFSEEEKAYIALKEKVYVAGKPDFFPFEYYDEDSKAFSGILPDLIAMISGISGLEFEYVNPGVRDSRFALAKNLQVEMVSSFLIGSEEEKAYGLDPGIPCVDWAADGKAGGVGFAYTEIAPGQLRSIVDKSLSAIGSSDRERILLSYVGQARKGRYHRWIVWGGLCAFAASLASALALAVSRRKKKKDEILYKYFDETTGLWNMRYLEKNFPLFITDENRTLYCAVYLGASLNHIREVYSDREADGILRHIADILMEHSENNELLARADTNYFVAVRKSESLEESVAWMKTIFRKIRSYSQEQSKDYVLEPKGGVYRLKQPDRELETALSNARQSHRYALQNNLSCAVCSDKMLRDFEESRSLELDAVKAVENKEFVMYLQPFVSLKTGRVEGCEALVRWQHPTRGFIKPFRFISLLEECNLITEVDFYIFESACKWIGGRLAAGLPAMPVSCNFSRANFRTDRFVSRLERIMELYGVPPRCIHIEVTESAISTYGAADKANLSSLFDGNLSIFLDDFGTGYTSFQDLKEYPVHTLKIDKSLLDDGAEEKGRAILQGLIDLGHKIGAKTLCEGVETGEQAEMLRSYGCDLAQGFYFHQPMPVQVMENLMETSLNGENKEEVMAEEDPAESREPEN